jgi:hypothetical protein
MASSEVSSRLLHKAVFKRNPFPPFWSWVASDYTSTRCGNGSGAWRCRLKRLLLTFLDAKRGGSLGQLRRSGSFIARGVSPWRVPEMG